MNVAQELKQRGFIHQTAGGELEEILKENRTFYLGIDPSADSLQIGNLAPLMLARHLSDAGHKAMILVGGATGQIGDPSGKKSERTLQDVRVIKSNTKAQIKQIQKIFGTKSFRIVNNSDWLRKLNLLSFLREIGKHFTVNSLVKRDLIKQRLQEENNSISYTEFSYALLQAYDFYYLNEKYKCDLQIGASDQWGNIVSGIELIRKKASKNAYGITMPLITDANGKKFGKSEGNAIWLNPTKTSPFEFYQFWINTPDEMVESYLKIFTMLSLEKIASVILEHKQNPKNRVAQKLLASEVTKFIHDDREAQKAVEMSSKAFGTGVGVGEGNKRCTIESGANIIDVLVKTELATSKSDARRLIEGGGVRLDSTVVTDPSITITNNDFNDETLRLWRGKKQFVDLVLK